MNFREGDFIQINDGSIFEVKGLVHPPNRVIAFLRYMIDSKGDRKFESRTYRKVYSINKRYEILKKIYPQFLTYDDVFNDYLPEVDHTSINYTFIPTQVLEELRKKTQLDDIQKKAVIFTEILKKEADITWSKVGITGSLSVGLYTKKSDIDIIIYGIEDSLRVRNAMKNLFHSEENIFEYTIKDLEKLYQFRVKDTRMPFEEFVKHERRKSLQGTFDGIDIYIRCIKDWGENEETYGEFIYQPKGYAKVRAKIIDDSENIFTPCKYVLDNVKLIEGDKVHDLREIVSFRGRFCEQAKNGESVIAQGKIEKVVGPQEDYYRILLGSSPSDFMITKDSDLD